MKFVLPALLLTSLISLAEIQSAKFSATELGNRWWQHDQFGIFYDANDSNWYYHIDHGWIYVDEWEDNGTWLFLPLEDNNRSNESNSSLSEEVALGWMWSKAEHYPQLYNNELEDWMYFNKERNNSKYYCYSLKKYLAEDFIFKTNTSPDDWKYLEPLFFIDDYESYETDLFPDIDVSYAGYWNVTIPKDELALDDNWSSLIQSIQDDENIRKKIGIRKIEEDESKYLIKFRPTRTLVLSAPESIELDIPFAVEEDLITGISDLNLTVIYPDLKTLKSFDSLLLKESVYPATSEIMLRSQDGSLHFDTYTNPVKGAVNLTQVRHAAISTTDYLNDAHFDRSKGDGHINFNTGHLNADGTTTPWIRIRDQGTISASSN